MPSTNGLVCFTNCALPLEDGSLIEKDLWIDEFRGVVLDAQRTFFTRKERPDKVIDLGGNILSPGFLDIQINGAYGFDFSVYDGDDQTYSQGLKTVMEKIVETGVTSFVPTIITQERSLYPRLLKLLRPFSLPNSATILGWHAEGPFLEPAKRGAHAPLLLLSADKGFKSFEDVYGVENLVDAQKWLMESNMEHDEGVGVRMITAAPEIQGVMNAAKELTARGIVFAIGHSIATSDVATAAVMRGARLITHLFNAMPQLHHRDPSIIGLLGAKPYLSFSSPSLSGLSSIKLQHPQKWSILDCVENSSTSEAFSDIETPPITPAFTPHHVISGTATPFDPASMNCSSVQLSQCIQEAVHIPFQKPFYDIIVDGIHSHPNSVRLAYSAYPEGCILITDAMKILDPHLCDGVHEWRDGKRFVKEGEKLYLEGTDTLAGSVVTLDKCVRNFSRFTGCSLGEAIKCATYNPAKCLGIENKKGTLRPGADADLVVLDRQGHVISTWVKGKEVWTKQA